MTAADGRLDGAAIASFRSSQRRARRMTWVWQDWIPDSSVTILSGKGGVGKTTLAVDIAARVATGRAMPGEEADAAVGVGRRVLWIGPDEAVDEALLPRIRAAGGQCDEFVVADVDADFVLPDDEDKLEADIVKFGYQFVVIDTLVSVADGDYDLKDCQGAAAVLGALRDIARRHRIAILVLNHVIKSTDGDKVDRTLGSGGGVIGTVRSAMHAGEVDADGGRRRWCLELVKSNYGACPAPLVYGFEGATVWDVDDDGADVAISTSRVVWFPDAVIGRSGERGRVGRALRVDDWLRRDLEAGPASGAAVLTRAKAAGFGEDAIYDAARRIGVDYVQHGRGKRWQLRLMPDERADAADIGSLDVPWDDGDA